MSLNDVRAWLAGNQNYRSGVALLIEHGKPSAPLLALLERGETGYARERLVEALRGLADKAPPQAVHTPTRLHPAAQAESVERALSPELDDWPMNRYPVDLQELKKEVITWMREQDTLHGELPRIPTREERYRTALRIKELDDMVHAAFYRLDTFRRTGTDIGRVEERPKSKAELMLERNNIRTYLSRYRKGTRPASPEQVEAWKTRLSIIQTTIDAGYQE